MGAEYFETRSKGKTVEAAFKAAVKKAQYDHGHAGYTGTIAEKRSEGFKLVKVPDEWAKLPLKYVGEVTEDQALMEKLNICDKWGPCGAVQLAEDEWVFFGWASS